MRWRGYESFLNAYSDAERMHTLSWVFDDCHLGSGRPLVIDERVLCGDLTTVITHERVLFSNPNSSTSSGSFSRETKSSEYLQRTRHHRTPALSWGRDFQGPEKGMGEEKRDQDTRTHSIYGSFTSGI
jgi:hypothetical protein